jgi:hypothetical protein
VDGTHLRVNAFVNAFVDAFVNAFVDAFVNAFVDAFVNGFRWHCIAGCRAARAAPVGVALELAPRFKKKVLSKSQHVPSCRL